MGRDLNGACFVMGMIARKGSSQVGERQGQMLVRFDRIRWWAEVDSGRFFWEIVGNGIQGEVVEIFSKDEFEFEDARIVGDKM